MRAAKTRHARCACPLPVERLITGADPLWFAVRRFAFDESERGEQRFDAFFEWDGAGVAGAARVPFDRALSFPDAEGDATNRRVGVSAARSAATRERKEPRAQKRLSQPTGAICSHASDPNPLRAGMALSVKLHVPVFPNLDDVQRARTEARTR